MGGGKGGTFGEARAAPTREDGGKGGRGVKGREAEGKGGERAGADRPTLCPPPHITCRSIRQVYSNKCRSKTI